MRVYTSKVKLSDKALKVCPAKTLYFALLIQCFSTKKSDLTLKYRCNSQV